MWRGEQVVRLLESKASFHIFWRANQSLIAETSEALRPYLSKLERSNYHIRASRQ